MKLLLLIFTLWTTCAVQAQTLVNARFATSEIRLVIPNGYCVTERNDPPGSADYKVQEELNKGHHIVAVLFAECGELAKRLADRSYAINHHGTYLFQLTNDQELFLPETETRADLIEAYTQYELKNAGLPVEAMTKYLDQKLKSATTKPPERKGPYNFGMIHKDSFAAFIGMGVTLQDKHGKVVRVNGVMAATVTRRVRVSITLYENNVGQKPLIGLLAQQKDLVRRLISANE